MKKHIQVSLLFILFLLTEFSLFISVNLIYHLKYTEPFLIVFEWIGGFLLFLLPIVLLYLLNFTKDLFKNNLFQNYFIYSLAFILFLSQLLMTNWINPKDSIKELSQQFYHCTPYAPWPMQTKFGKKITKKVFNSLGNKAQYTWYNIEDHCRVLKLKKDFVDLFPYKPMYCGNKTRHDCLLETLYSINKTTPLSTNAMIGIMDFGGKRIVLEKDYLLGVNTKIQNTDKVKILLESAFQLMDLAIWTLHAGYYSTIDLKLKRFPNRAIASLENRKQKLLAHNLISYDVGTTPSFIDVLNINKTQDLIRKTAGIKLSIWDNARFKLIDHYLRDELLTKNKNYMKQLKLKIIEQIEIARKHNLLSKVDYQYYNNELNLKIQKLGLN